MSRFLQIFARQNIDSKHLLGQPSRGQAQQVLWLSTTAFTLLFAVWLMLGVIGIPIRDEFQLSAEQFEWALALSILAGSLPRLQFGIWSEKYGGRPMMIGILLFCALPTFLLSQVTNYGGLLACAVLFGLAGNSFSVGVVWISSWYPQSEKGTALGIFGAGNVGASLTKFLVPALLVFGPLVGMSQGLSNGGWRVIPVIYALLLLLMAAALWRWTPSPDRCPGRDRSLADLLKPLENVRVWRFGLYYVVVFGAYVALATYLPRHYVDEYGLSLTTAGYLTALFIFPASLLRPLGGWLSDQYGARLLSYTVFIAMLATLSLLSLPKSILELSMTTFTVLIVALGCCMGIGKAAVFKYIPTYFPNDVGAVAGLVGTLGALGGFILPPLLGMMSRLGLGSQVAFFPLWVLTLISLGWLHLTVLGLLWENRSHASLLIPANLEPNASEPSRVRQADASEAIGMTNS